MISSLRGTVLEKWEQSLLIEVHGVGYEVRVTPALWQHARAGAELLVYTHFHVREDAQVLYGFVDAQERTMFQTLLTVNGVGPKVAMSVLSVASPKEIVTAVQREDGTGLKAPGVGPKIVKRLIAELKTVFGEMPQFSAQDQGGQASIRMDVNNALASLGYNEREIETMLMGLELDGRNVEDVVRAALKKR